MSLIHDFDKQALSIGNSDNSYELNFSHHNWLFLIEGIIIGAPIIFIDNTSPKALLLRYSHLKLEEPRKSEIINALTSSYKNWGGIPLEANIRLENPPLLSIATSDDTEDTKTELYFIVKKLLDMHFWQIKAAMFSILNLSKYNDLNRVGAGIQIKPTGEIMPLNISPYQIPPIVIRSHTVEATLTFKDNATMTSVEKAFINAISWFRQGRLEKNVISKFNAYWTSFESCFPPSLFRKRDLKKNISMFFGFFNAQHLSLMGSANQTIVNALPANLNEIDTIFDMIYDLRVNIVHYAITELTEPSTKSDEFVLGIYILRYQILNKCINLLEDAIAHGVTDLTQIWPNHALNFIFSPRYTRRNDEFCKSLFIIPRSDLNLKNIDKFAI